jgi:hypothetical protein
MTPPTDHPEADTYAPEALTSIGSTYTLAATNESEGSEVERLMVKNFIETLAEISLAVASRKIKEQGQ